MDPTLAALMNADLFAGRARMNNQFDNIAAQSASGNMMDMRMTGYFGLSQLFDVQLGQLAASAVAPSTVPHPNQTYPYAAPGAAAGS